MFIEAPPVSKPWKPAKECKKKLKLNLDSVSVVLLFWIKLLFIAIEVVPYTQFFVMIALDVYIYSRLTSINLRHIT